MKSRYCVIEASIRLGNLPYGQQSEIRRMIDADEVSPIAASDIRYPPVVRAIDPGKYSIVDGTHRLASMVAAGENRLPVLVVEGPPGWHRNIDTDSVIGDHPELDAIYATRRL